MVDPETWAAKTRIQAFDEAAQWFNRLSELLKSKQWAEEKELLRTPEAPKYFLEASFANAVLYSLGRERLLELEHEGTIHPSTISGGSLDAALVGVKLYLSGRIRELDRDRFEQLSRSCQSLKQLEEATDKTRHKSYQIQ